MILAPEDCGCPIIEEGPSIINSPVCSGNYLFMMLLQSYLWGRCDISTPCERIISVDKPEKRYDFIVVGGGTAGSVVAGRLAENQSFSVLLLEAGGPEPIGSRIPSFYREFWGNEDLDWAYRAQPADYCLDQGSKGCSWPRGKVLGGSSVLNGMMYHRGHKADFEDWVAAGAEGWSWDDVKPYMDMSEGNKQIGTLVKDENHSSKGPMPVQTFNYQPPALKDLLAGINESFPVIDDLNDLNTPTGFTVAQMFSDHGQRYTTARVYLQPKSGNSNLNITLHSHVSKVIFDDSDKNHPPKAIGVEYIDKNGTTHTIYARKEVILSAGALNSPQILMLSGVGPAETLKKFNIDVKSDLPVGKNFRNHVGVTFYFLLKKVNNTNVLDWNVLTEYLLTRGGPMSSTGLTQLTGLLYSSLANRSREQPDLQFFFNGLYAECSKEGLIGESAGCSQSSYNVSSNTGTVKPRSVGHLTINSTDPMEPALFYANYFSHPDDLVMVKDGIKFLHQIFKSSTLQEKYEIELDPEYTKACKNSGKEWSDKWNECMIRTYTDAQNHQLGTTAIGSVLDTELRVYNVSGLRVCDAGSMPTQPTGNPQAIIVAVAERCAHFIKRHWA